MPLYRLEQIVQRYAGRPVLSVDHWSVEQGIITGLYGPNGSGKSTLLKLLGFVEAPAKGEIHFQGRRAEPYARRIRDRVALMPQESYLLKRTVYKNVAYGLRIRGDRADEKERIGRALSLVGLDPDRFAGRPWYALSGGEARRVALAARLVLNPAVLLLDEPTTSVDAANARMMKEAAVEAHRNLGTSLVIASHDLGWLEAVCHEVVYMFNGRILEKGRKTFIFGPWEKTAEGRARRRLADGQVFEAYNAPAGLAGTAAAVDPEDLGIHATRREVPPGKAALEGILMRLCLEKHAGRISLGVTVGQTDFTLYLDAGALSEKGFQPGATVWLAYHPERVAWYTVSADQHQPADARHPDGPRAVVKRRALHVPSRGRVET